MRTRFHALVVMIPFAAVLLPTAVAAQWRYPPPYPPYGAYRYAQPESHLRLNVQPKEAAVYVDGYFAGRVEEFDGRFQRLHVLPGEHAITVYLEGYRSLTERLYLSPNATRTIDGRLEKLAAGEPQDPEPTPSDEPRAGSQAPDDEDYPVPWRGPIGRRGPSDQPPPRRPGDEPPRRYPNDTGRDGRTDSRYASLSIRVQPGGAIVRIDGERWDGPANDERLIVQVSEGHHVIEVERDGYEPFTSDVDVRRGETVPVNISLRRR